MEVKNKTGKKGPFRHNIHTSKGIGGGESKYGDTSDTEDNNIAAQLSRLRSKYDKTEELAKELQKTIKSSQRQRHQEAKNSQRSSRHNYLRLNIICRRSIINNIMFYIFNVGFNTI